MYVTAFLLVLLGAMFMKGFKEVIGLAVALVGIYLVLNVVVIGAGIARLSERPELTAHWWSRIEANDWMLSKAPFGLGGQGGGLLMLVGVVFLLFPSLALGLSGFETGVAVMPLVKGAVNDDPKNPLGRIRNTRKLLLLAAVIMSVGLLGSSMLVSTLIPPTDLIYFDETGQPVKSDDWPKDKPKPDQKLPAHERALAYLAHGENPKLNAQAEVVTDETGLAIRDPLLPFFGSVFGTIYDLSTVVILWFAGASAMAGLLNLVPKYLPRYGMAPEWAGAIRPLVILLTGINLLVTVIFKADVSAQGDAYATGVLVLMSSAAVATVIEKWRTKTGTFGRRLSIPYAFILVVFVYTTAAVIFEKPVGLMISCCFILAILVISLISRIRRAGELRFGGFRLLDGQSKLLWDAIRHLELTILVPHRPGRRSLAEKEQAIRKEHRIPRDLMVVFVEVDLEDTSEFAPQPIIEVKEEQGRYVLKISKAASISHTLAALALEMAKVGRPPEIHFGWTEQSPMSGMFGFLLFGEGNVPWMVRELVRRAEPDPDRRPLILIAGA